MICRGGCANYLCARPSRNQIFLRTVFNRLKKSILRGGLEHMPSLEIDFLEAVDVLDNL
jgi:hypothetical protein